MNNKRMRKKTHENPDKYDHIYGNSHYLSPPHFTKSPLIIHNSHHKDSKSINNESNPGKWSLGSLMAALPLTPSPVCSTSIGDVSDSSFSSLHCDFSRVSAEFYTPNHQCSSILSSTSFKKQEQSPKCKSISTLYESTIDHQGYKLAEKRQGNALESYTYSPKRLLPSSVPYDHELSTATAEVYNSRFSYPLLPCVSKERGYPQMKNSVRNRVDFARVQPVTTMEVEHEAKEEHCSPVNRPKPYQEFLDEVQKHKRQAELDAWWKIAYTDLLNKLKKKEADIDNWESNQRSKAEFKLDRIERKLDKKRAKATQKIHKKVAEAKMEAERRKARERQSVLKEMAKLSRTCQGQKPKILCFPWFSRDG